MRYTIKVARREREEFGYDREPYVATAVRSDGKVIAAQFGTHAPIAFQRALRFVDEDREREGVEVEV